MGNQFLYCVTACRYACGQRCSATMNSVIKRYDNMVLFACQGTASQSYFMRQVTIHQFPDHDSREKSRLDALLQCTSELSSTRDKKNFVCNAIQDPMFSKRVASLEVPQQQLQNMWPAASWSPLFAKPLFGSTEGRQTTPTEGHLTVQVMNNFNVTSERLTLWKADLDDEGGVDTAYDGCKGILHVASAMEFEFEDPE